MPGAASKAMGARPARATLVSNRRARGFGLIVHRPIVKRRVQSPAGDQAASLISIANPRRTCLKRLGREAPRGQPRQMRLQGAPPVHSAARVFSNSSDGRHRCRTNASAAAERVPLAQRPRSRLGCLQPSSSRLVERTTALGRHGAALGGPSAHSRARQRDVTPKSNIPRPRRSSHDASRNPANGSIE